MRRIEFSVVLIALFVLSIHGQDTPIRIDFSGDTAEENGITIQGPGFNAYPQAEIVYSEIPKFNAFVDATDGRGAIVTAAPGQGVMIIGETIHTTNAAMIRCSVRSNAPSVAVTLAIIDAGEYQFISTTTPNNGAFFEGQYKRLSGFFVPPSTGFRPLIQVLNTGSSQTATVYLDNLDVYLLDSERFYNARFLDGDENDPTTISQPDASVEATRSIGVMPSCAAIDIGKQIGFSCDYTIDGNGQMHWWTGNTGIVTLTGNGTAKGIAGGNRRVAVQFGSLGGSALVFVNPIASTHNDRTYEWYQTQMGTGPGSYNNCGPTSTQMVLHWYLGTTLSVAAIREFSPRDYGWWYTTDITNTLDKYGVPYAIHSARKNSDVLNCLKRGNIVILCSEMKWIDYSQQPFYGRFYSFDSGHFYVVKGYSIDENYFVVYDPNAWQNDYDDQGIMLGRNRYYAADEALRSIKDWWPYCIEIGGSAAGGGLKPASVPIASAGPRGSYHDLANE